MNHIIEGVEKPENEMLFVGYQVRGTPGRDILTWYRKPDGYVVMEGEKLRIRAGIHLMPGYSAHADRNGLLEWVNGMPEKPGRIKLVHGGERARLALQEGL